jgi:hypothetical protein
MRQGRFGETVLNPPDTNGRGLEDCRWWVVIAGIAVPVSAYFFPEARERVICALPMIRPVRCGDVAAQLKALRSASLNSSRDRSLEPFL